MLKLYKSQGIAVFSLFLCLFLLIFSIENFAQGFQSVTNLNSLTVSAITGEKPQSKVWTYAGKWWMVMPNSSGTQIWRLDGTTWTSVLNIDASTATYADCKAFGNVTHILLYKGTSSSLVSVEYVPSSNTYQLWTTRTSTVPITLDSGVETATIDVDGTGRMWLASPGTTSIYVRWSDSPYSTWSSPITIATGVNDDDICAIATFDGKIGVLWSNQSTQRFGFKYHIDGDDPTIWSTDEVPASQSALNVGLGMADDHLNMAVASDGTLYCAVKTSYDTPGYTKIALLVRRPAGTWDDLYPVDEAGTRGIVLLNESNKKIFLVYTSSEGNNPIIYKSSSTTTISFGSATTLISSACNDVSSTKQNIIDNAAIFASNGSAVFSVLANDNSLVGHWMMEENSGATSLIDSSPFGNNATVTGSLTQIAGRRGYAQNFTGAANYALALNSTSLNITNNITLAAWIKPEANTTQDVLNKKVNGTTNGFELTLSAQTAPVSQKVFVRFNQVTSGDTYRINSTTTYPTDGTWIHAAATYDGATIKLYINGVLESSLPAAITIASNTLPIGLGAQSNGDASREFSGAIDDARIYNVALAQSEIQTLLSTWTPPPSVPTTPILLSPTDGSISIALNPTLTWNASAGATSYQVQVSTVSNFSTTVYDQSGITSTNTSVSGLSNGTLYYWRVDATNASGTSAWSTVWSFTTIGVIPPIEDNGAGYSLDFDGTNGSTLSDYVNCGNGSSLDITQSITIEAWVKPAITKTHSIVKKYTITNSGYELFLENAANGRISFRLNGNTTYRVNSTTYYNQPLSTWIHVAGTYDYTTKLMKIFVNGKEEGSVTGPNSIVSLSSPLVIGSELTDFSKSFQGSIDEVRVWNVARSDADIKANMTKKLVGNEAGLVGYWRFDELSGTLMNDETLNNNDGTMTNMDAATDHVWSGAALGDASAFDYVATGGYSATLNHTDGDAITATTTSGTISGLQVYRSDDNAVRTGSTVPTGYTLDALRFWGVKAIGTATPTYTLVYNYAGNPAVLNENGLKLVKRNDISVPAWTDALATLDMNTNTLTVTGATGTEYALAIPTVTPPDPPTLLSPADLATGIAISPTLSWNASSGSTSYQVQVSTESNFATTVFNQSGIIATTASVTPALINNTLYYWRVNATNAGGPSAWSTVWSFTTIPITSAYGLQFNGTNQFVTFGPATSTLGTPTFTLECWFNWTGGGTTVSTGTGGLTAAYPLITKGRGEGDGSNVDANYFLGIQGTGVNARLAADFEDIDGVTIDGDPAGQNQPIVGTIAVTANVWHHVAATFDGTFWRLYLDGVLDNTLDVTNLGFTPPRPQFNSIQHAGLATAMTSTGAAAGYFAGVIDEAHIWNFARTQMQIQASINSELTSGTGLLGRWGLNDGSGVSAANSIAGSPAGTLVNTPTWATPGAPFNITFIVPGAPTLLVATAISTAQINLSWTDNASTEAAFEIERSTAGESGPFTLLATVNANTTSYSDIGLTQSTQYWYQVRAVNGGGNSAYTNVANATTLSPTPPTAPTSLTVTAPSAYQVNLSWTDNSNDETTFEIERSTTGIGGTYSLLATVGANITAYSDATVSPTNEYCYKVRATNGNGPSAYSNSDCATIPVEGNYALDFGTSNAYVTFGNNASLGLANITIETWFKREGTGTTANTGTGGMNAIPLVTKGRGEAENSNVDMNYFIGIRASDNVLAADFEEGAAGTTPGLNHPVFGTTPIVNDVWYHAAATYDGTTWYLYLNGNLEAQLYVGQPLRSDCIQHAGLGTAMNSTGVTEGHFDGVLDEVRIWNYARTSGEIVATINSQIITAQTGLVARWGLNEGIGTGVNGSAGTSVTGTITGTGSSWVTPGAPFNISFLPPTAPTNLVVTTISSSELQLSWNDNSDNESGFEIERSTTGIGGTYSLLTTVAANTTTYLNQALTPETEYCYQVRAINSGGNSAYTNTYCATTDIEPSIATLTFQEGVNGYTGTLDTYIWGAPTEVNNSFGTNEEVQWDGSDLPPGQTEAGEQDAIIRFDNIFGTGTGQIPTSAVIQSATLTYTVFDVGNEANVYNVLVNNWSESTSWNTFGLNPGIQAEDYNSTMVVATNGSGVAGEKTINVTSSITAWLANPSENYGWLIRPTGNSGVGFRSSEYGTITARPKLTVNYLANPPDQPVLVAPLDNSVNISTSPQLSLMVSDPENRNLTVRFYGRPVSSTTPGEDFTIIALPDAQNYTAGLSGGTMAMFTAQTNWCVSELNTRNIAYIAMEGDITNDNIEPQWVNAVTAMSILESPLPGIPYGISLGNHDGAPDNTALYNNNFGISRFTGRSYYGGHYGSDNNNSYVFFSAGGMEFIAIHLGFGNATPTAEVFAWANNLMQTYSTHRAIIVSHDLLSGNNWTTAGQAIYDALKGNPNLFLMLAGHLDTEGLRTDTFNGNTIYTVRTDYQGTGSGGNGWLRIFTFSPANNNFTISSYSPYLNQSNFGGNSPIILPYEMSPTNDYVLVGTNTNVTSDSTTSITWPGRLNNTEYEWYVEVSNGESTITGPTWSFTTEQAAVPEYEVYLSSSTSAASDILYPNTDWGVTTYDPDDWNFTSPVSLYIVPEVGSVFGACDVTIQWDNTLYGYVGVENSGIYSGSNFQILHSTNGTTDQVIINAARTDNANFTISAGQYIAKLNLNLLKSGNGTVDFTALNFRSFNGLGGQTTVTVTGNNGTLKSYLGDVASSADTMFTGDGYVDFDDLSPWSGSYWSGVPPFGMINYKVKYDVGPTTTSTVYGIPIPDAKIQFEDLIIFSMSYGLSANNVYPKINAEPTAPVELQLGEPVITGNQTRVPLYVSGGVQNVRAMSLTFAGQFGKLISVERGSLLTEFKNPVMVMSNTDGNQVFVDLAVLGVEEVGINSKGEVLTLIFEGNTELSLSTAEVRNILNHPMAVDISGTEGLVPAEFALMQNYPNPFNPTTTINYELPKQAMVEISVFNALGERVAKLVNEIKEAGRHTVEFNAIGYSSGIYFYQIKANDFVSVKKMILMK